MANIRLTPIGALVTRIAIQFEYPFEDLVDQCHGTRTTRGIVIIGIEIRVHLVGMQSGEFMCARGLERGLGPRDGGEQQLAQFTVEQEQGVQIIETRAILIPVVTLGQTRLPVKEQILIAIDDRIITLTPEHMSRIGIDGHAPHAQDAQLLVHTPVGLAQRHGSTSSDPMMKALRPSRIHEIASANRTESGLFRFYKITPIPRKRNPTGRLVA
ncbi:hypothetical protein LMG11579_0973 [Bifidobacterium adolescentis]|nr:hypothetical protein LMG11579_0973 [Bifidobacterium adolescentis]